MLMELKVRWKIILGLTMLTVLMVVLAVASKDADAQRKIIYWGNSGNDVTIVQTKLKDWGYYKGPVDGYYSPETFQAVKNFQAKNGLMVDGVVGAQTWAALGYDVAFAQGQTQAQAQRPTAPRSTTASRGGSVHNGDVYLLAKVVMGEAADEPYLGKVAVAAVLLNRVKSSEFPNTLAGVVYQPLAFESVSNGQYNRTLSEESVNAAQAAMNGWDPTGGAIFFWNPYKPVSSWIWSRTITGQIGAHVFGI